MGLMPPQFREICTDGVQLSQPWCRKRVCVKEFIDFGRSSTKGELKCQSEPTPRSATRKEGPGYHRCTGCKIGSPCAHATNAEAAHVRVYTAVSLKICALDKRRYELRSTFRSWLSFRETLWGKTLWNSVLRLELRAKKTVLARICEGGGSLRPRREGGRSHQDKMDKHVASPLLQ